MKTFTKVLLALLFAGNAFAGSLEVKDEAGLIGNRPAIEAAAQAANFDTRILVSSNRGHGAQFDAFVDGGLKGSNQAVIGVDPVGHHTHIRVGGALGIPGSLVGSIAITANGNFKAGEWDAGIARIISGLQAERRVSAPLAPVTVPVAPVAVAPVYVAQPSTPVSGWVWFWSIVVILFVLWFAYYLYRKARQQHLEDEERELAADLVRKTDYYHTTPDYERRKESRALSNFTEPYREPTRAVVAPSSTTIVHTDSGRNTMMDYMIMDNIINHHNQPTPAYVAPTPVYTPPAPSYDPGPSYGSSSGSSDWGSSSDSSSSSSSWGSDSSSSSSGSSDWGSSSSSFDSGSSSFDSGSSFGGDSGGSSW